MCYRMHNNEKCRTNLVIVLEFYTLDDGTSKSCEERFNWTWTYTFTWNPLPLWRKRDRYVPRSINIYMNNDNIRMHLRAFCGIWNRQLWIRSAIGLWSLGVVSVKLFPKQNTWITNNWARNMRNMRSWVETIYRGIWMNTEVANDYDRLATLKKKKKSVWITNIELFNK